MRPSDYSYDSFASNGINREFYLETGPLQRPGADRGLGRYAQSMLDGYREIGAKVTPITSPNFLGAALELWKKRPGANAVYHATSPYGIPPLKHLRWMCSIQDVIPLDLKEYSRLGIKSKVLFKNAMRSDCLLTNSNYTRNRLLEMYSAQPEKIRTLPLPVNPIFFLQSDSANASPEVPKYVSAMVDLRTPDPRKRAHWLAPLAEELSKVGLSLQVTGRGLDQIASMIPHATPVITETDEHLRDFFAGAIAHVYTSAYEGQGLPPLEAMATGSPVIAFDNTSVGEMVGSTQFLLEDPAPWESFNLAADLPSTVVDHIVDICVALSKDDGYWRQYSVAAKRRASDFSNERFVEKLGEILKDVIA